LKSDASYQDTNNQDTIHGTSLRSDNIRAPPPVQMTIKDDDEGDLMNLNYYFYKLTSFCHKYIFADPPSYDDVVWGG